MMTRSMTTMAALFLAIGILVGAGGAILARDVTRQDAADHMAQGQMVLMPSMMGGAGSMMGGAEHRWHHGGTMPGPMAVPSPAR